MPASDGGAESSTHHYDGGGPISIEMKELGVEKDVASNQLSENQNSINIQTNHCYVMFFTLTFLCGSTLQGGWAVAECGQVGLVLDKKLGWNASITDDSKEG